MIRLIPCKLCLQGFLAGLPVVIRIVNIKRSKDFNYG